MRELLPGQTSTIDSLSAFFPGVQVLHGDIESAIQGHLVYWNLWKKYSAIPESWEHNKREIVWAGWPGRPEFIESTYYLHRVRTSILPTDARPQATTFICASVNASYITLFAAPKRAAALLQSQMSRREHWKIAWSPSCCPRPSSISTSSLTHHHHHHHQTQSSQPRAIPFACHLISLTHHH